MFMQAAHHVFVRVGVTVCFFEVSFVGKRQFNKTGKSEREKERERERAPEQRNMEEIIK